MYIENGKVLKTKMTSDKDVEIMQGLLDTLLNNTVKGMVYGFNKERAVPFNNTFECLQGSLHNVNYLIEQLWYSVIGKDVHQLKLNTPYLTIGGDIKIFTDYGKNNSTQSGHATVVSNGVYTYNRAIGHSQFCNGRVTGSHERYHGNIAMVDGRFVELTSDMEYNIPLESLESKHYQFYNAKSLEDLIEEKFLWEFLNNDCIWIAVGFEMSEKEADKHFFKQRPVNYRKQETQINENEGR